MDANRFVAGAHPIVRRLQNLVVGVALHAARQAHLGKSGLMGTFFKKLLVERVAGATDIGDRSHARRSCAVVAVARGAGRGGSVAARERLGVHAIGVQRELVRGNVVALHVRGVRVALRAGAGDVGWINRRARVGNGQDIVNAVAIHARGHLRIALFQPFAVDAGQVFAVLVRADAGIITAHVTGIRMAASAEIRDLRFLGNTAESLGGAHRVHGKIFGSPPWQSAQPSPALGGGRRPR